MTKQQTEALKPCGGCGETDSSKRCMGCLHDFGTPESAWVRTALATPSPATSDTLVEACDCARRYDPDQIDHEAGCAYVRTGEAPMTDTLEPSPIALGKDAVARAMGAVLPTEYDWQHIRQASAAFVERLTALHAGTDTLERREAIARIAEDHTHGGIRQLYEKKLGNEIVASCVGTECACGAAFAGGDMQEVRALWAGHLAEQIDALSLPAREWERPPPREVEADLAEACGSAAITIRGLVALARIKFGNLDPDANSLFDAALKHAEALNRLSEEG
ncbi:MAG: hypothetical protein EON59_04040 [Alphaproteobacteria bacterium]|nr:MAG: hypothetical protein EON59_04040 [Alphaproteobacteria bacterium]